MKNYVKRFLYVIGICFALIGAGSLIAYALPDKSSDEISMREVLTIASYYDINHVTMPIIPHSVDSSFTILWGLTDPMTRKIIINEAAPLEYRPQVLLHEMYYIKHNAEGKTQDEKYIDSLATVTYKKLFGVK